MAPLYNLASLTDLDEDDRLPGFAAINDVSSFAKEHGLSSRIHRLHLHSSDWSFKESWEWHVLWLRQVTPHLTLFTCATPVSALLVKSSGWHRAQTSFQQEPLQTLCPPDVFRDNTLQYSIHESIQIIVATILSIYIY